MIELNIYYIIIYMQIHRHDDYYDDSDYYMYVLSVAICFLLCPVLGPQDAVQKE